MSWDLIVGSLMGVMVFLSLAVMYGALIAPLFFFGALFIIPLWVALMTAISGAQAITWGWMYDEHEVLGTEPDAVPG